MWGGGGVGRPFTEDTKSQCQPLSWRTENRISTGVASFIHATQASGEGREDDNRHTCTNSSSPHFRLGFLYSTTETKAASQLSTDCNSSLGEVFKRHRFAQCTSSQRRLLKARCRGLADFLAETVPHSADCPPFFSPGTSFFSSSSPAKPQEPIHTLLIAPLKIHLLPGKIRAQERRRFLKTALFEAKQL